MNENEGEGEMSKKLLDDYLHSVISGYVAQAKAISNIKHKLTKGQIREFFIQNLLQHFLPGYLDVASGIVMNNRGEQSKETDIIIYDTRLLPPFLFSGNLNIFPIESVVATIEVKSFLNKPSLEKAERDATHLTETIWKNNKRLVSPDPPLPLPCLFGFDGNRIGGMATSDNTWITKNIKSLRLICSVEKFSWARLFFQKEGEEEKKLHWVFGEPDQKNLKEIRRFLAILVDNLRTIANNIWFWSSATHNDLLGQYIRYLG